MVKHPYPREAADFADFRTCLREFVLPGFIPESPPLNRSDIVVTQGSCFAENIHKALEAQGIVSKYNPFLELANSPAANRLFLDYALRGTPFRTARHERSYIGAIPKTAAKLLSCKMLIFTVGVAWEPTIDGELASGYGKDDLANLTWRLSSVGENTEHLSAVIETVQEVNPEAAIVLTVSPIPIKNSFGSESAVVADCMSKTNLRAAVTEIMGRKIEGVYYWPSFEAVRWLSGHMGPFFGIDGEKHRRVGVSYIQIIVDEFIRAFFRV